MLQFDIITIFPEIFSNYFSESIISRAQKKGLIKIKIHNLRDWAFGKHKKVDDKPYGGGPGMALKVEPITRAIVSILKSKIQNPKSKIQVVLFSAGGKQFDNRTAINFTKKYNRIVIICGHYEGVDERVKKVVSDLGFRISDFSIGPYVLTGGELPAMILVDAVTRQIPGVLGKEESLEEKRFGIGVPTYTRPEVFDYKEKKYRVPKVLLSGDHKKIEEWRRKKIKK
jgi:tRNA (guanine37-N1)-methyltransferase